MLICSLILLVIIVISLGKNDNINDAYSVNQNLPIRGILVLLVIFNHLFESAYMLGNIAVSMFFCFSGYGLIKCYETKKDYFNGYILKKVKNILIPYFLINILYIIWNIFGLNKIYTFIQLVSSFFTASIMSVGWYVIVAFILYLIFYFVYKYLKLNEYKKIGIILLLVLLLMAVFYLFHCGSWWYCSLFAFPLGMIMALESKKYLIKKYIVNKYTFIFSLIIFVCSYIYAFAYKLNDGLIYLAIKFSHSVLICIIYFNVFRKYKINNRTLGLIGKNSLIIYMIHPLILNILKHFNLILNLDFVNFIIIFLLSFLFSLIEKKVFKVLLLKENNNKI